MCESYIILEEKCMVLFKSFYYTIHREWANQQTENVIPIAFDMEWPFSFTTGSGRTAVIQMCANLDTCYVFHVYNLKKLPAALFLLLSHERVCLHGVNIKKYVLN